MTDAVRMTWLGHSTVVLERAGVRVVTDPLLGRHAGVLRRRGPRPERVWQGAAAAVVSHLHHDHAELSSLRLLGDVPVLTAPANARWLRSRGIAGGTGLRPDEWFDVAPGVSVRLTPAVHGHRPMPHRPNAANGHLVRFAGADGRGALTVWAVGDTELFGGLAAVPELAGGPPDVVLVPVSGWGPRLSGGHMGPLQAAELCALVGARAAVPVHWGTLHAPGGRYLPPGWMDRPGELFAVEVARVAPTTRVLVLRPGGSDEVAAA
ncbi:MBL fold metallo-hydrolase [Luteimicrobium subarcticum]|uniref:L-ascorbate metabolism protein UlaG (Beta-lactamase superfamily) n=1 Tax=Luteimicrobium subarcticum TaxID=620910 RepID=A0A2M8WU07_9MICO|nr:MBL fold metallo-hydrolase [Luteimicrobium subarcticum]PJI94379.1 L-ascorbate metabolism protein UlaG (beta-lactamase superfamily) [Luteimicrobium subarcticum]